MAAKSEPRLPANPLVIVVTRRFDAPSELVFDAWLDAQNAGRWLFKTADGRMQRVEIDPRVGGNFVVAEQRGDVLAEHFGRYEELDRSRRIVFLFSLSNFADPDEVVSRVTIDITPSGRGCELTLTHEIDPQWAEYEGRTRSGWTMILDNLTSTLLGEREIMSSRVLNAPRERVFQAFSDPQQLALWWGPNDFTNTIKEFDLRPGGTWRIVMHSPNGADFDNHSVFIEVVAPERIVYDHLEPVHRFRMTMNLADKNGGTRLEWRMLFDSVEECEKVKPFIVAANEQNFDRLAAHLGIQ